MSEYDIRPGGSLKLKGGVIEGGVVKKYVETPLSTPSHSSCRNRKKKKSKRTNEGESKDQELDKVKELLFKEVEKEGTPSGSGRNSPAVEGSSNSSRKTDAEKRFEEVQRKRVCPCSILCNPVAHWLVLQLEQRINKLAHKTHKDRVNEFNAHLESLSEHHDIPKVCSLLR